MYCTRKKQPGVDLVFTFSVKKVRVGDANLRDYKHAGASLHALHYFSLVSRVQKRDRLALKQAEEVARTAQDRPTKRPVERKKKGPVVMGPHQIQDSGELTNVSP